MKKETDARRSFDPARATGWLRVTGSYCVILSEAKNLRGAIRQVAFVFATVLLLICGVAIAMFRVGIVKTQDTANCRVRVTFPDRNQMTSWWLPIAVPKAQNDKAYWMPDIGEQVVCLMDEHDEDGAVLGSMYSTVDMPPVSSPDKWHATMRDGATFEYDRSTHALAVSIPSGGTVTISANGATVQIDSSGNVTVSANGNAAINSSGNTNVNASGNINLSSSGVISLVTATHNDSVDGIINTFNSHTHAHGPVPDQQMS